MHEITGMPEVQVLMAVMIRNSIVMIEKVEKEMYSNVVQHVKRNLDLYPLQLPLRLHHRLSLIVARLEVNGMMEVVTTTKTWFHRAANSFSHVQLVILQYLMGTWNSFNFFFSYILTIRPLPLCKVQHDQVCLAVFKPTIFNFRNPADFVSSAVPLCSSALVVPL